MRICLLSRFYDLRNAGIGRYSMELLHKLKEEECEVLIVSQDGGIPLGEGMAKYFIYTAFEIPFKIPNADIYHALTPLEAIHAPKPLVVTFHDFIPLLYTGEIKTHYAKNRLERWFTRNYFRIACSIAVKKADAMTAVSGQTKEELMQTFDVGGKDIKVVRHGISPDLEPESKDDIFRIGYLGHLVPRKRIDLLIEAFLNADVDGELLISGKSPEKERLKRLARNDDRIKFLYIPDDELKNFYNSLDWFALPSKFEGFGLPAIESMACKVPVVTLSDAMIPSDIKKRTLVVESLEDWLKNLDPSSINLEENYRFAKNHNWKKCANKYLRIYEEVI